MAKTEKLSGELSKPIQAMSDLLTILQGDALARLRELPTESVHCCVTSPPYWSLRDYSCEGQLGLEKTTEEYVAKMVEVFREVRRVLREDGTLWMNMGDSYAQGGKMVDESERKSRMVNAHKLVGGGCSTWKDRGDRAANTAISGLKPKDLCGIPWRLAFALQADGWWLRSDIIWHKPNPMPESCTDRPTKSHEYLFLLTKAPVYFYDSESIREPELSPGRSEAEIQRQRKRRDGNEFRKGDLVNDSCGTWRGEGNYTGGRNKRSVWSIATQPYSDWAMDSEKADYVGVDGNPYKLSADCPIHAHLADLLRQRKQQYGELPNLDDLRKDGISIRRGAGHGVERDASSSQTSDKNAPPNAHWQTTGNIDENKTLVLPSSADDLSGDAQNPLSTNRTLDESMLKADNLDSPFPVDAPIASERNTENRKNISSRARYDTASEQIPSSKPDNAPVASLHNQPQNISESNTSEGSGQRDLFDQKSDRKPRMSKPRSKATCTCSICQMSHFATFPPEIPKLCILAGTSAKGCCAKCGTPWERMVEREFRSLNSKRPNMTGQDFMEGWEGTTNGYTDVKTLGWQPASAKATARQADHNCKDYPVVPCTILDPFAGSGTSGAVALELGRKAVLIELNPAYVELIKQRCNITPGLALA